MPPLAVFRDRHLFRFRHSPWGLPSANLTPAGVLWSPETAVGGPDVLYLRRGGTWEAVPWPPSLWWLRFLLVADHVTAGTRVEARAALTNLERVWLWWAQRTDPAAQASFGCHPQLAAVVRALTASVHPHERRLAWDLRAARRACAEHAPHVLGGCDPSSDLTPPRPARALNLVLRHTACGVPYALDAPTVGALLLRRYGVRLGDASGPVHDREYLVHPDHLPADRADLRAACVRRFGPPLHCCVLRLGSDTYLADLREDGRWREGLHHLVVLARACPVLLLDGAPGVRRAWYAAAEVPHVDRCVLVPDYDAAVHWAETLEQAADTVGWFVRARPATRPSLACRWVYVDGCQRLAADSHWLPLLAHLAATVPPPLGVVFAGDARGASRLPPTDRLWAAWVRCRARVTPGGGLRLVSCPPGPPSPPLVLPLDAAVADYQRQARAPDAPTPWLLTTRPGDARAFVPVAPPGDPRLRDGSPVHVGDRLRCVVARCPPLRLGHLYRVAALGVASEAPGTLTLVDLSAEGGESGSPRIDLPLDVASHALGPSRGGAGLRLARRPDAHYGTDPVYCVVAAPGGRLPASALQELGDLGSAVTVVVVHAPSAPRPPPHADHGDPDAAVPNTAVWERVFEALALTCSQEGP